MHVSYETDGEIVGGGNPNSNYSDDRHFWKKKIFDKQNICFYSMWQERNTLSCEIMVVLIGFALQTHKLTDHISIPHVLWMDYNEIHWRDQSH